MSNESRPYSTPYSSSYQTSESQLYGSATEHISLNKPLITAVILLLGIGLIMVASSSIAIGHRYYHNSFYFFTKQFIFAIAGIGAMAFMLYVPTTYLQRGKNIWLLLGILLLIMVLLPGIGNAVNGSRRWIHLGPLRLQVSELIKLCSILYVAGYFAKYGPEVRETLFGIIKPLLILSIMAVLLLLEPDFGATVVLFATAMGIMFMAKVKWHWFVILIVLGSLAAIGLIFISPYRVARLTGFLHPWINQRTSGYQLTQSLIAFGKGGFFGSGLGNGIQKLFYLPEAHTDFILAVIAEELGLIGILAILAAFTTLVWQGLMIARRAHLRQYIFDAYLAYGITFWLGIQVVVNFCVNIGLLPTKGLTLPLISYGGSSLLIDMAAIGILLRIDLQNS